MAQNTRSQCSRPRGIELGSQPLSEAEMDAFKHQMAEKEKQLKEQNDALYRQQQELEQRQREFEETRNGNLDIHNFNHILSSIQKDLSSLKTLNEQFQNLEKRVNEVQNNPDYTTPRETPIDVSYNNPLARNAAQFDLPLPVTSNIPLPHPGTNYPNSSIRDALELVPKFDGHNMPVLQFARACKRAKELIPLTNENHLVRLLRNKLIGHAYLAVEDEIHSSVDQLIDCLKRTFGPARTSNYYRGQLSINFKKPSEHILDYIGRVKDLRNAIIEGDQIQLCRPLNKHEVDQIDSYALESFFEGLPPEYRTEIRMEGYNTLPEAYNRAVLINKRLERDRIRQRDAKPNSTRTNPTSSVERGTPGVSIKQPDRQQPSADTSPMQTKICAYCKNFGHLISECKKRQYNNAARENRQGNSPGPSTSGASQGQANARPMYPIITEAPESPSSNSTPEPSPLSN